MLCHCYSCSRTMDCSPDGVCELCEADGKRKATSPKQNKDHIVAGNNELKVPKVGKVDYVSTDHQIYSILRRLHNTMAGPERDCRWNHSDKDQIYWCQHVAIRAGDVADHYWSQFAEM